MEHHHVWQVNQLSMGPEMMIFHLDLAFRTRVPPGRQKYRAFCAEKMAQQQLWAARKNWEVLSYDPIGSVCMVYMVLYGNIYHQYTPFMLAYIPYIRIRHGLWHAKNIIERCKQLDDWGRSYGPNYGQNIIWKNHEIGRKRCWNQLKSHWFSYRSNLCLFKREAARISLKGVCMEIKLRCLPENETHMRGRPWKCS